MVANTLIEAKHSTVFNLVARLWQSREPEQHSRGLPPECKVFFGGTNQQQPKPASRPHSINHNTTNLTCPNVAEARYGGLNCSI